MDALKFITMDWAEEEFQSIPANTLLAALCCMFLGCLLIWIWNPNGISMYLAQIGAAFGGVGIIKDIHRPFMARLALLATVWAVAFFLFYL